MAKPDSLILVHQIVIATFDDPAADSVEAATRHSIPTPPKP